MDEPRPADAAGTPRPRARLRRTLAALTAVAALAGFAGLVKYAYDRGRQAGGGDRPPIVRADPSPHKIKPAQPGGMDVPNRDKQVYGRLDPDRAKPRTERLLPPPETPKPPRPAEAAPAAPVSAESKPVASTSAAPAPAAAAPAPAVSAPVASTPTAATPTAATPAATTPTAPPQPPPAPPARKPRAAPADAPPAAAAASARPGGYRVQLASVRDRAAAIRTWTRLRKTHADLLGRLNPRIQRRDLGKQKGVFFRVQAGPLADAAAARRVCGALKRRGAGCVVVRP